MAAAGETHTVLLRSDGTAVACGDNRDAQCDLPPLGAGQTYVQVAAGLEHTVLLRSDGMAVACGFNGHGRCNVPALDAGCVYGLPAPVLQASLEGEFIVIQTLNGEELFRIGAAPTSRPVKSLLASCLAGMACPKFARADVVLPRGALLSGSAREQTVAGAFGLALGG
mmetsp:Transcript_74294/g.207586  ORF Transcript_74294/g.207586 Transcript_74294/m.207586 type:complete len:168 (+) Transcript_74294:62-565(+)